MENREIATEVNSQKQSTTLQAVAIVFILAFATKMFLLPVYLIRATGRDGYIAVAINGAIDLLSLGLMLVAMRLSPDKDFFSLLTSALGKVGAKITVALFGLFLFLKINIAASEVLTFYSDNVFSDFDTVIMTIILALFLVAVGSHTLRAVARLNELLVPLISACIVVLITIVAVTGFDLANIFPAMRDGATFGDSLLRHAAWLGDFTPLALFIGRTDMKKRGGIFIAASGGVGTAIAVFFALVMSAAFGNVNTLTDSSTNITNILQFSLGNVYGRIDLFSAVVWSVSSFIELALFFYCASRCFSYLTVRSHFWVSVTLSVVMFFLQTFFITDPTVFSYLTQSYAVSAITVFFAFAVPLIAIFCALRGKRGSKNIKAELKEA